MKPFSWCLEKGGTRGQGDMVPPIPPTYPQAPISCYNGQMQNKHIPRKLATVDCKSKGKTQEHNATATRDKLQKAFQAAQILSSSQFFREGS